MNRLLTAAILVISCAPALAQQGEPQEAKTVTHMSVSLDDCRRLLRHEARDDVTYKAGVDVHGNAVAPADIQPLGAIKVPDEIVIDFGLDLAGRYGFGAAALFDVTAGIATIQYDLASGTLTFNGKELLQDDQRAIERACKLRLQNDDGAQ
ncbi:hypothetical protein [Magnetovibrio sp.]|uniref:hypothetical protein n=1 Tax=Magnetovibrio sp. TaxID=2024836 RepID=UPI002F91C30C